MEKNGKIIIIKHLKYRKQDDDKHVIPSIQNTTSKLSRFRPKSRIKRRLHNHFINGHKIQFVQAYCGLNIKDSCERGTKRDNERDGP